MQTMRKNGLLQMRDRGNIRLQGEHVRLWETHTPQDVDDNPDYFDRVVGKIIGPELSDPMSEIGTPFEVFLGNPRGEYYFRTCRVMDVKKIIRENGADMYHLVWKYETNSSWEHWPPIVSEVSESSTIDSNDVMAVPMETDPEKRGPGRPRKEAA